MQNYDMLVERIATSSGLGKEEIEKRIEAKKAKLSGLISKEGAAQIIAAELGVSFENVDAKIVELMPGLRKVNVLGKVINVFPVREYNKNNRQGKIGSLVIADETGNIRVVLWDTNHISLIEQGMIKEGVVIEIKNAAMRDQELHLSGFSEVKVSIKTILNVKTERTMQDKTIGELNDGSSGQGVKVRGIVVQLFNPRFFSVCPACGKKVMPDVEGFRCEEHGNVLPKERALINFVLDDGTESVRVVLFSDVINKLIPEEDLKNLEKLANFREDFLGTEIWLKGIVRKNQLFNNLEITGQDIEKVNVEKLIEILEKK